MALKYQRVGAHVSAAGGLQNAPDNAKELGCECFQFFSRSPRGGPAPTISNEEAKEYRNKCEQFGFESYIHTPYYINFASKNKRIYHGSVRVVREELERGSKISVKYVVTHMGSAKDFVSDTHTTKTPKEALRQVIQGLREVFAGNREFSSRLLLEISAGAGSVVGDSFEELRYLIDGLGRSDVHICLDTCHLLATGYDIRTQEALDEVMKQFRQTLGLEQLKLVHINDSKAELNGRVDRHEHIGKGTIGVKGFQALLAHPDFQKVNLILETPTEKGMREDIKFIKKYRSVSSRTCLAHRSR